MRLGDNSEGGLSVRTGDKNGVVFGLSKSIGKIFKEGFINSMVDGIIGLKNSEIEEEAIRDINDALTNAQEKIVGSGVLQGIFDKHGVAHPGKFLDEKGKTSGARGAGKIAGIRTKDKEKRLKRV